MIFRLFIFIIWQTVKIGIRNDRIAPVFICRYGSITCVLNRSFTYHANNFIQVHILLRLYGFQLIDIWHAVAVRINCTSLIWFFIQPHRNRNWSLQINPMTVTHYMISDLICDFHNFRVKIIMDIAKNTVGTLIQIPVYSLFSGGRYHTAADSFIFQQSNLRCHGRNTISVLRFVCSVCNKNKYFSRRCPHVQQSGCFQSIYSALIRISSPSGSELRNLRLVCFSIIKPVRSAVCMYKRTV